MLDIRRLRAEPSAVKDALAKRDPGLATVVDRVLELDETRREALGLVNDLKAQRNDVSRKIGELKRDGGDADALIVEMREVGNRIAELDEIVRAADEEIASHMLALPNTPLDAVPGGGEEANEVFAAWGSPAEFPFEPKPHWKWRSTCRSSTCRVVQSSAARAFQC